MELNQETLKKAYNYLSKDPCLDHLINKFSNNINISERYNKNYPLALAYLIMEQQCLFIKLPKHLNYGMVLSQKLIMKYLNF